MNYLDDDRELGFVMSIKDDFPNIDKKDLLNHR